MLRIQIIIIIHVGLWNGGNLTIVSAVIGLPSIKETSVIIKRLWVSWILVLNSFWAHLRKIKIVYLQKLKNLRFLWGGLRILDVNFYWYGPWIYGFNLSAFWEGVISGFVYGCVNCAGADIFFGGFDLIKIKIPANILKRKSFIPECSTNSWFKIPTRSSLSMSLKFLRIYSG